jgi:hypothetical protein
MKSGTRKFKIFLLTAGAIVIVATAILWPHVMFWHSKQQAFNNLSRLDASQRLGWRAVLAPDVRHIPVAGDQGESIAVRMGGWVFTLPKDRYHPSADANQTRLLEADNLAVRFDGVRSKLPDFSAKFSPTNKEVVRYFREVDPYQILSDAFNSTPRDIETASTPEELQKALYLLLVRTSLQTNGADRLWQRIEVRGRAGFLSGDETCKAVIATIYLPQTRQFAELAIEPRKGATMDDVYNCLAALDIHRDPNVATRPATGKFPWPKLPLTTSAPNNP